MIVIFPFKKIYIYLFNGYECFDSMNKCAHIWAWSRWRTEEAARFRRPAVSTHRGGEPLQTTHAPNNWATSPAIKWSLFKKGQVYFAFLSLWFQRESPFLLSWKWQTPLPLISRLNIYILENVRQCFLITSTTHDGLRYLNTCPSQNYLHILKPEAFHGNCCLHEQIFTRHRDGSIVNV